MGTSLEVKGLEELLRDLEKMSVNIDEVQEKAIAEAAQLVLKDAQSTTAFKDHTGKLRRSFKASPVRIGKDGSQESWIGDIDREVGYSWYVEFGHSQVAARPFLAPALRHKRSEVLQLIRKKLEEALDK